MLPIESIVPPRPSTEEDLLNDFVVLGGRSYKIVSGSENEELILTIKHLQAETAKVKEQVELHELAMNELDKKFCALKRRFDETKKNSDDVKKFAYGSIGLTILSIFSQIASFFMGNVK